jgi:hypothetical protein
MTELDRAIALVRSLADEATNELVEELTRDGRAVWVLDPHME